jgi:glutamyl-tRNA synthetase
VTTGRYAPTPSGPLHVGNLRTALLAWCYARHDGGRFVMRVEDLTTGAAPVAQREQLDDLASLGIDHDGPVVLQSEHLDRYAAAIDRLVAAGRTYECYCTRREIRDAASAPHGAGGLQPYPGTCRHLTAEQVADRLAEGRRPALRLAAEGEPVEVRDELLGVLRAPVDDLVLRRGDGMPAYNLTVVVDDAADGVDQVVRGDDLWFTTPRQVLLHRLLGLAPPQYVHVPLVLGDDGERLAKRHGAISLGQLAEVGIGPAEVVGACAASMGLAEVGETFLAEELLERFDPERLDIGPHVHTVPDGS